MRAMNGATFGARYDAIISEPRMRALYGASGYFNTGYWPAGVTKLVDACDRLVDEIASVIPSDAQTMVDVGCGLGAGTRRIADRFPAALVVGLNLSLWQLAQVKARGVGALVTDAARQALASDAIDAVTAIESPQHFDTRAHFFAEAHRVLRPGGVLTLSDMLFINEETIGAWMLPPANRITTLADYTRTLADAGFVDINVRDATDICWRPYCAAMRGVFAGHEDSLRAIEESLSFYLLASARKADIPRISASMQNEVVSSSEPHHGVSG
ncbi:MAG: methyltransferase protein [Acidobacteria bacterium]|nr:methyltransferase protein [Acidobacteriota bacterium]